MSAKRNCDGTSWIVGCGDQHLAARAASCRPKNRDPGRRRRTARACAHVSVSARAREERDVTITHAAASSAAAAGHPWPGSADHRLLPATSSQSCRPRDPNKNSTYSSMGAAGCLRSPFLWLPSSSRFTVDSTGTFFF